jgi:hypothetical protein
MELNTLRKPATGVAMTNKLCSEFFAHKGGKGPDEMLMEPGNWMPAK